MCRRVASSYLFLGNAGTACLGGSERHIFFGLKLPCLLGGILGTTANAAKKDMPSTA